MSNKSLFSKALLKKDFKILFPLFWTNIIFLIIAFPFRYTQIIAKLQDKNILKSEIPYIIRSISSNSSDNLAISTFSVIICIVVSIILFGNEKNKKTIEMISVAPFSRKQIYINKIAIGLFVSIVPLIVIYLISYMILMTDPLISSLTNFDHIKKIFTIIIFINLTVFSYYIMISMLFGSTLSTLVCGTIFTFYPVALPVLFNGIVNDFFSEEVIELFTKITPFARLAYAVDDLNSYTYLSIVCIIMLIAGYYLFDIYKMEKNSEFLTFKWTEIIFKIGILVSSALLGGNILNAILTGISDFEFVNKALGLIVGAGFGYIIPKAIISRSKVA